MASPTAVAPPATNRTTTKVVHRSELEPVPSKAAIAGHPIHPMLIPFPLALLFLVPVTDIVYAQTQNVFWASVSYYLLWAGLISAGVAAIFGLIDFISIERAHSVRAGWVHIVLNMAIITLSLVNLVLRLGNKLQYILPEGLIFSIVATTLLAVSGWYGGELVYRYKVGMSDR